MNMIKSISGSDKVNMIKSIKRKFIKRIIDFYDYQILSLSMEMSYNKKCSNQEIKHMADKVNEFNNITNVLRYILIDLENDRL
ncbi:MAG TPA: hypothetical protein K8V90_10100 [Romboutsia timonensis]|uniref:Uncharacterized protein n=1 Tax=Romboutsia timonensis TaxID=1776391 RepID=A0A921N1U9_9FIRM|nr:hypothetical protein [Romboutsia timonensis]